MRMIFTFNIKSIPCQLWRHYWSVNIFSDVDLIGSCFRGRLVHLLSIFQCWRIQRREIEMFLVTFESKFLTYFTLNQKYALVNLYVLPVMKFPYSCRYAGFVTLFGRLYSSTACARFPWYSSGWFLSLLKQPHMAAAVNNHSKL